MLGDGQRLADDEWLLPDQPGTPLTEILQQRRAFFVRASAVALLLGVMILSGVGPRAPLSVASERAVAGPPPGDRALLWFPLDQPPDPLVVRLQAFDWVGHRVGRVSIPCRGPCSFAASPDGQRLLVYEVAPLGQPALPGIVYDAHGRPISTLADPSARWADDSRHLCLLHAPAIANQKPFASETALEVIDADKGRGRFVTSVTGVNALSDPAYWELLACSVTSDRAVIGFSGQQAVHDLIVVRLSTGRTIYARHDLAAGAVCGCPIEDIVTARNAALAVENMVGGTVEILDLSSGLPAPSPGGSAIAGPLLGLSWQGRRALAPGGIIDVGTGRRTWEAPAPLIPSLTAARPASDDLLVYLSRPNGVGAMEVIVAGDGWHIPLPVNPP